MNLQETGTLLTLIAELDNRRFTKETAVSWHRILGRFGFEEARQAVEEHFTNSTDWLLPAHLVRIMKSKRRARLEHFEAINPNRVDGEDVAHELRVRKEITEAIATGKMTARMYDDYHRANVPFADYRAEPGRYRLEAPPGDPVRVEAITSRLGKTIN